MPDPPPDAWSGADDVCPDAACTVLHVDMDAFFAAVEVLDAPHLAGRPVVVGGDGRRGVVASCTYEARAYGIHSAMPSLEARRRCPHAVFLPGRYRRYAELSERFRRILLDVTPVVEPVGLDEAFLDVAGAGVGVESPAGLAWSIRRRVRQDLSLDCAVGVARTKVLAKLASRAAKPTASRRGTRPGAAVVVIEPFAELAFLHPLPVRALWGVGPATAARLGKVGIATVGDLAAVPPDSLRRLLGDAAGHHLAELAQGRDGRRVVHDRSAKSISHEETFADDLHTHAQLHRHAVRMGDAVSARLHEAGLAGRTVGIKVRYGDLSTVTRAHTVDAPVDAARTIAAIADALLRDVDVSSGVRLLGVGVSSLVGASAAGVRQLSFSDVAPLSGGPPGTGTGRAGPPASVVPLQGAAVDGVAQDRWEQVDAAVATVRARYGQGAVGSATLVGAGGLSVKSRGDTHWGPTDATDDLTSSTSEPPAEAPPPPRPRRTRR